MTYPEPRRAGSHATMPGKSTSNAGAASDVDRDQFEAFRYELGTSNRETVLASFDRRDDYARMRFPPRTPNPGSHQANVPADPVLAGWKNFHLTTTDRDLDAEKQDHLHDGQLFRLNRQARGEAIHHPPPAVRRSEPSLNPLLNNPGNADPLALARALQFKGSYKAGKGRPPISNPHASSAPLGSVGRGGYAGRGRGGSVLSSNGRNGPTQSGTLNPHADIHADQRLPARKKKASVVGGGMSTVQARPMLGAAFTNRPTNNLRPPPAQINHGRNGIPNQQLSKGAHVAPMMDRSNSSRSTASMASSTVGSSSSGALFATGRRHPAPVGNLATPEEFMAAVKKNGLAGSKYAPKPEDKKNQQEKTETTKPAEPKIKSTMGGGLSGSRFAA
ncbi:negative regulator of dna transposition protein [Diplodia corticola]|uniref:Negative regulator of dna transposition protein n=1 Tax=Diplodia corticola TaxID=236234 RepID=A0A1J9S1L7_9PEZI|nr:negative regulator of dna transposition protein [Diplodia corticola]OJD33549.1 negative regulator of dna transposition protein [Diplodia corticola]